MKLYFDYFIHLHENNIYDQLMKKIDLQRDKIKSIQALTLQITKMKESYDKEYSYLVSHIERIEEVIKTGKDSNNISFARSKESLEVALERKNELEIAILKETRKIKDLRNTVAKEEKKFKNLVDSIKKLEGKKEQPISVKEIPEKKKVKTISKKVEAKPAKTKALAVIQKKKSEVETIGNKIDKGIKNVQTTIKDVKQGKHVDVIPKKVVKQLKRGGKILGASAVVAFVIGTTFGIYRRYYTEVGKKCGHIEDYVNRKICEREVKKNALRLRINLLRNNLGKCDQTTNPEKCRQDILNKIKELEIKLGRL